MRLEIDITNPQTIVDAINSLDSYQDSLKLKTEHFVRRLSDVGIKVVKVVMSSVPSETKGVYDIETYVENDGEYIKSARIALMGDKVLFVEFSAGVRFGTPKGGYPLESGKEFGVGTYPGQTHAFNEKGWNYLGEDGMWHHSYGNKAYMPMYKADMEIALQTMAIAREVFNG